MLKKAQEIQKQIEKEMEKSEPNGTKADILCKMVEKIASGVVGEPLVCFVNDIFKLVEKKISWARLAQWVEQAHIDIKVYASTQKVQASSLTCDNFLHVFPLSLHV